MSYLELQQVHKRFGATTVIQGVNLQIEQGEFVVFVGPSGCGKSTLLRLIAGLTELDQGKVILEGRDISALPAGKRDLAMVFQSYALYPHMSVEQNMSFALRMAGESRAIIAQKVAHAAEILNLGPYLKRTPKELSGGQRQRVAIGRAIVRAPKVFLFDEPLSNLDAALRSQTRIEIAKLHRELGTTTIYVTHDQVEAMTLADRVVVLNHGQVEQQGRPLDLYDRPQKKFVAQFIGTPAMTVLAIDAIGALQAPLRQLHAQADSFGIRPEAVQVNAAAPVTAFTLSGTIELIESLGADTLIYVSVDGVLLTARQSQRSDCRYGQTVTVTLDPRAIHLFDAHGTVLAQT